MATQSKKNCPQCGKAVAKTAKYCNACGASLADSTSMQVIEVPKSAVTKPDIKIKTIDDVQSYLLKLAESANESIVCALQAQIQVLRYVQSPHLVDGTFEMLFENTRKALKYAVSEAERKEIQEKTSLMIHNYLFWVQARLDFEYHMIEDDESDNREQMRKLVANAAEMLADTVVQVATVAATTAISGGTTVAIKAAVTNDLVTSLNDPNKQAQRKGLFRRLIDWWTAEDRINERWEKYEQRQIEFYQSLDKLIEKLAKRSSIIGKSNLVAGIIDRYAGDLCHYHFRTQLNDAIRIKSDAVELGIRWMRGLAIGSIVVLAIAFVGRAIYRMFASLYNKFFADGVSTPWALTHLKYSALILVGVLAVVLLIFGVWYLCGVCVDLKAKRGMKKLEGAYMQVAKLYETTDDIY